MHQKCYQVGQLIAMIAVYGVSVQAPAFAARPQLPIRQVQIVDEAMCCAGCARNVSSQLYTMRGVKEVGVDLKSRTLTVSLPAPSPAVLGQLWHAVEQGKGTPTKLVTAEATYTLVRPKVEPIDQSSHAATAQTIVIDNLHCQGCAKKIVTQIYTLKGVTKVSVDMEKETLFVESHPKVQLSPWSLVDAVAKAKERPIAIFGGHGELKIKYATKAAPKTHQQALQPRTQGIQR
ncbi:cation transporter [Adhaeretor mobilis]|uniref:Zinc/cadmium/mercury/lead-transporting ATPase n=1 Tax=Adhaeretor mobilis TaxID=1930276 RepID=A0A517MRP2_9BACT|nr:cation transporter [Adhaeretor mobilis]QDS97551.1 zinc/cadmium/mercury/lead-transporting ATPase [Adhaeretor mobilis]